ncbi:MAG: helix-turn-helix domain-containing protein [Egibacteraceae bacterium]
MASPFGERSPSRRRLGAALRRLRIAAGLPGEQLAERLSVSQSQVSRVELGQTVANPDLVDRWATLCGADDEQRAGLVDAAEAVTVEATAWRKALPRGLARMQQETADVEASATVISAYVPLFVPGLIQTASYAYELVSAAYPDRADVAAAVAARMERQTGLYDRSKTLRWVIGEAGLRWRMATTDVMLAQLDRVAMLAAEPHLDIRVLPLTCRTAVWHDHGFTIFADRADDQPDLVHIETLTAGLNVTDAAQVTAYRQAYDTLAELAVGGAEAARLIRQIMAELAEPSAG